MASHSEGFSFENEENGTHYVPFFSAYRLRDLAVKLKIYQIALIAVSIISLIVIVTLSIVLTSCTYRNNCPSSTSSPSTVTVYYAGSLVDVMSRMIGPGVLKEYNIAINATSAATGIIAAKLQNGASVDLFISASISTSAQLLTSTYNSKPLSTWFVIYTNNIYLKHIVHTMCISPYIGTYLSVALGLASHTVINRHIQPYFRA